MLLLAVTLAVASVAISGRTVDRALRRLAQGCLKTTLLSDVREAWLGGWLDAGFPRIAVEGRERLPGGVAQAQEALPGAASAI